MRNLNIYSENTYAIKAIQFLMKKNKRIFHSKHSISIFIFIKEWITDEDFNALLQNTSDKVLIIASESVLSFVRKNINMEVIEYLSCSARMDEIEKIMSSLLVLPHRKFCKKNHHIEDNPLLTETEMNIILLYLSGNKSTYIAEILGLKPLLVKKHKASAMNKMGLINEQSLIRHWHLLYRLSLTDLLGVRTFS